MSIKHVGIVGTGQMGLGIAQLLAQQSIQVTAVKMTGGDTSGKEAQVQAAFQKLVDREKITADAMKAALDQLTITADLHALKDCDLVIESILEEVDQKKDVFKRLDDTCKDSTILASNTSTLCITELAQAVDRKDRFIGLHFFNPATLMKLVEVVGTMDTDDTVLAEVTQWVRSIGKEPVPVKDETGFIVNRLLTPYMVDAVRSLERNLAGVADIDAAMKMGANHPMGPLELADFIGLDIVFHMATNLYETFREPRLAPPPLLQRLVLAGQLGRKSGKGFYDYSEKPATPRSF